MTLEQLGATANTAGYVMPLLLSLSIASTYARPYFFHWSLSYMFYTPAIMALAIPAPYSGWLSITTVVTVCYSLGSWYLLRAAEETRPAQAPFRKMRMAWWAALLIAEGLLLAGQPLGIAFIAPGLFQVATHLRFAAQVWRLEKAATQRSARTLATLLALVGTWALAFPLLSNTPYLWVGAVVSGALHLLVGIQMVIYMLDDVAATLRVQNAQLQELDSLKSSFISTVSHELRTPVTAIKSASWLLTASKHSADPAELGQIIAQQADQLSHIVDDMLDFSVLESGGMNYTRERFALDELAEEAVQGVSTMFLEKGVTLACEPGAMPVPVAADPERLKQVISNLLANALKFTEPGGEVIVSVEVEGPFARLTVSDTGIGIAPEHQSRVFERFYQVDGSNTRRAGGAGLGLAISRAIVEEGHLGRIWVESSPGSGSKFIVALPLAASLVESAR